MIQGSRAQRVKREFMMRLPRLGITLAQRAAGEARILDFPRLRRQRIVLDDPSHEGSQVALFLRVSVASPADLVELATAEVLKGEIFGLSVRIAKMPAWLAGGVRPRLRRNTWRMRWSRTKSGLKVGLLWTRPQQVSSALQDVLSAVTRASSWDQTSGPVPRLDRTAWLSNSSTWPQGRLAARATVSDGAFQDLVASSLRFPLVYSAITNPVGRRLLGAATFYRLGVQPGRLVLRDAQAQVVDVMGRGAGLTVDAGVDRYSVVGIDAPPADIYQVSAMCSLAAFGAVFAASDMDVRRDLTALGLTTVANPAEVKDLRGYALSVAASRRMAIMADPALRRTALNHGGDGALPLPAVSVVLSSMRPDSVAQILSYLAKQDYPAYEVVLGLHGYEVPPETTERWQEVLPVPLRVRSFPKELPFGAVLGGLSGIADGELITKVDDDDHYGSHHLTDLFLAMHATGADLVAKGARFVYLQDEDRTIDRTWAMPETFDVTVAGGTLLLARSALTKAGGWSHAPRHVDADLIARIRAAGGITYRTHSMEYVYVRQAKGHTWQADLEELVEQGGKSYAGLPPELMPAHKEE